MASVFLGALETASSIEAVHIALGSGNDKLTIQSNTLGPDDRGHGRRC